MKTIRLLICAALPALFAACADNDLASSPSVETQDGNLVKLEKGFALAFTRGENAETRTSWQLDDLDGSGLFYGWIPDLVQPQTNYEPVLEDIGLAWRGEVENAEVKTNYKFTLGGYLKKGETTPKFRNCNGELAITNGFVFGAPGTAQEIALNEYDATNHDMSKVSDYKLVLNTTTSKGEWELQKTSTKVNDMYDASKLEEGAPNVRTGLFTTTNSTVFAGNYIVYFPYNPSFANTGHLPATSPAEFTMDTELDGNLAAHLTGKTFAYGAAEIVKGGSMAEGFKVKNLSSVIGLNIENKTGENQNIAKVILYDEDEESRGFYTSVGLDAEKIWAEGDETTGKALYVEDEAEYSPTLILNFKGASNDYVTVNDGDKQPGVLAALPVDLKKPVAYVMFDDGLSVKKELEPKELTGGDRKKWDIVLTADDLQNEVRVAVDTKSFIQAWVDIYENGNANGENTIETLGNIVFDTTPSVTGTSRSGAEWTFDIDTQEEGFLFNKNVTITGPGTITVPADLTWYIKGFGTAANTAPTLTIQNPIIIESAGCCGTREGRLVLGNAKDKYGNYVIAQTVTNYGKMVAGINSGVGQYTFAGDILNKNDDENGYQAEIEFAGAEDNKIVVRGKIDNEGFVSVKDSVYTVKDDEWGEQLTKTPGVEVTVEGGLNNKLESSELHVNKETKLFLNGTSTNNGKIEIQTFGSSTDQSKEGTLQMEQGSTLNNNGMIHNQGVFTNDRGTLNLNEGSEFVDFVGSQYGGVPATDPIEGKYICEVDDAKNTEGDRLAYALGSEMSTNVVRFVEGPSGTDHYKYDLEKYRKYAKLGEVKYEFTAAQNFDISCTGEKITFGKGVTVNGATKVDFSSGDIEIDGDLTAKTGSTEVGAQATLTVKGDVNMETGSTSLKVNAKSDVAANETTTPKDLTVTGDVNLKGSVEMELVKNGAMQVDGNLTIGEGTTAKFNYSSYTWVASEIGVNGTFTRIVSAGTDTANPAKVWCGSYTTGSGATITNGYPEVRRK